MNLDRNVGGLISRERETGACGGSCGLALGREEVGFEGVERSVMVRSYGR